MFIAVVDFQMLRRKWGRWGKRRLVAILSTVHPRTLVPILQRWNDNAVDVLLGFTLVGFTNTFILQYELHCSNLLKTSKSFFCL